MSELKDTLRNDVLSESGLFLREEEFLNVLFDLYRGDVRKAMDHVGYPKDTPQYAVTKKLSKHIQERSKDFISASTARASVELVGTLSDPTAPGVKNVISAAKEILDRGGVYKEEKILSVDEKTMFILPPKEQSVEDE